MFIFEPDMFIFVAAHTALIMMQTHPMERTPKVVVYFSNVRIYLLRYKITDSEAII